MSSIKYKVVEITGKKLSILILCFFVKRIKCWFANLVIRQRNSKEKEPKYHEGSLYQIIVFTFGIFERDKLKNVSKILYFLEQRK